MEELDGIFEEKTAALDGEDLTKILPILLTNKEPGGKPTTERANSVP